MPFQPKTIFPTVSPLFNKAFLFMYKKIYLSNKYYNVYKTYIYIFFYKQYPPLGMCGQNKYTVNYLQNINSHTVEAGMDNGWNGVNGVLSTTWKPHLWDVLYHSIDTIPAITMSHPPLSSLHCSHSMSWTVIIFQKNHNYAIKCKILLLHDWNHDHGHD